ncbi:MAG: metallophosphoesterase [Sphingomonadales bacterium]|nr:metallophosphoesterase [Sphingomonadales bacterium]
MTPKPAQTLHLLHLSDLHFGRVNPGLVEPLLQAVQGLAPDLVVISGDLTQRARAGQFAQARAFLDRLPVPWLAVPGNHDIPLDRPLLRVLRPFGAYRRAICRDLAPGVDLPGLSVLGFNTATPRHWQAGRIAPARFLALLARVRAAKARGQVVAVVVHHPFSQPPGTLKRPMEGAAAALEALAAAGTDLILSGHLHRWAVVGLDAPEGGARLLQVQAGTTLSTRERGAPNDFALIEVTPGDPARLVIARHAARDPGGFSEIARQGFSRAGDQWRPEPSQSGKMPGEVSAPSSKRAR